MRGQGELTCNEDVGFALMVAIKMGEDAYRNNKVLLWDAEKERVVPA